MEVGPVHALFKWVLPVHAVPQGAVHHRDSLRRDEADNVHEVYGMCGRKVCKHFVRPEIRLYTDTLCLDCPNKIPALAHYELQSNVSLIAAASVAERRFLGFSADSCTSLGLG